MKKFLLAFLCMLTLGISPGLAADYSVTFVNQSSDSGDDTNPLSTASTKTDLIVESDLDYVSTATIAGNVYKGKVGYGIKLASGKGDGAMVVSLNDNYQVVANSISVLCANTDNGYTKQLNYVVKYEDNSIQSGSLNINHTNLGNEVIDNLSNDLKIVSIQFFKAKDNECQCYVKSFTVDYNGGVASAEGTAETLFHETFGDNENSIRNWDDSYFAHSGIENVYSGCSESVQNARQTKNTMGSVLSAIEAKENETGIYTVGPLNLSDCSNVTLSYKWKPGSIKNGATYSTSIFYKIGSSTTTWTQINHNTTPTAGGSYCDVSVSVPKGAIASNVYFKVEFTCSGAASDIDEFDLTGTYDNSAPTYTANIAPATNSVTVGETCTLTCSLTGGTATSYQWYSNTINSSGGGTPISGASSATYNVPTATAGTYYYYCVVNGNVKSNVASVSVTANSTGGGESGDYKFQLVTSQSGIVAGGEYVICAATSNYMIGTKKTNNFEGVTFTLDNGEITSLPEDGQVVKFLANANHPSNFDMLLTSDNTYLAGTGASTSSNGTNNNKLGAVANVSYNTEASIIYDDINSVVKITFVNNYERAGKYLYYNGQGTTNHLFNAYVADQPASGYEYLRLFKKVSATATPVASVTLNKTEAALVVGATETLTATVEPDDATDKTVTWSSSDSNVASVDENGKVTAVAPGTATITATAGGVTSSVCVVTVKLPAPTFTVNGAGVSLKEGTTNVYTATYVNSATISLVGIGTNIGVYTIGTNYTSADHLFEDSNNVTYEDGTPITTTGVDMTIQAIAWDGDSFSDVITLELTRVEGPFTPGAVPAGQFRDHLTAEALSLTTSDSEFSNFSGDSDAIYAGKASKQGDAIKLSTDASTFIKTSVSGGYVRQIAVNWDQNNNTLYTVKSSGNAANRKLYIYGSNEENAPESLDGLTRIATIDHSNVTNNNYVNIADDYEYIWLNANGGALYMDDIYVTWEPKESQEPQEIPAPGFTVNGTALTATSGNNYSYEGYGNAEITFTGATQTGWDVYYCIDSEYTDAEEIFGYGTKATGAVTINAPATAKKIQAVILDNQDNLGPIANLTLTLQNAPTFVDHIVRGDLAATSSGYVPFENVKKTDTNEINSKAVYAGTTAGGSNGKECIQINTKDYADRNIHTTASGGNLKKVKVVWNSTNSNANNRKINIYASNDPMTTASGSPVATIQYHTNDTQGEAEINGEYKYLLLASDGAAYLNDIYITWENPNPNKPDDVIFNPASSALIGAGVNKNNHTVTVTSERANKIEWQIDGVSQIPLTTDSNGQASLPEINTNCTITAWGVNTSVSPNESGDPVSADYTVILMPAAPTFSPEAGAVLKGSQVTITAPAQCDKLEYKVNDAETWTEVTSPFNYTVNEDVTLTARATNAAGTTVSAPQAYTLISTTTVPTFSPAGGEGQHIAYGAYVTITCNDANVDQIRYQVNSQEPVTLNVDEKKSVIFRLLATDTAIVKAWGVVSGLVADEEYMGSTSFVMDLRAEKTYRKTMDEEDLNEGHEYIIVTATATNNKYVAMGELNANGTASVESVSPNSTTGKITLSPDLSSAVPVILRKNGSKYALEVAAFNGANAGKFIAVANDKLAYSENGTDANSLISITPKTTDTELKFNNDKVLQCNTGLTAFTLVAGNQKKVLLYMEDQAVTTVKKVKAQITGETDDDGYYTRAAMVVLSTNTSGATIKYQIGTLGDTWLDYDANNGLTVNSPATIYAKAMKEGLTDSAVAEFSYDFRPATPEITVTPAALGFGKNVAIATETPGATIYYKIDEGEWQTYGEPIALNAVGTYAITAYANYSAYTTHPNSANAVQQVTISETGDEHDIHTFESGDLGKNWSANNTDAVINNVKWHLNMTPNDAYLGTNTDSGQQIGSRNNPLSSATISTSEIPGTIKSVYVSVRGYESGTVKVKVGTPESGYTYFTTSSNSDTQNFGTTYPTNAYKFEGEATGDIVIEFTNSKRAMYVKFMNVDYIESVSETKVQTPTFSPKAGYVDENTEVTLSCGTDGATIYYTLNGTDPDQTSTEYTAPIVITQDTQIMARAYKEGMIESLIARANYKLVENEYYELITKDDKIYENDRVILVCAVPYQSATQTEPHYWYMTETVPAGRDYWEAAPIDASKILETNDNGIPTRIAIGIDEKPMVIVLELDGSGSETSEERPWLLRADRGDHEGQYLQSTSEKKFTFIDLPELEERSGMNGRVEVKDALVDPDDPKSGDFHNYVTDKMHRIDMLDKGVMTFYGTDEVVMRFNPSGTKEHFNCYGYMTEGVVNLHGDTYPIRLYRATPVLPPSLTVYGKEVKADVEDTHNYLADPISADVVTFYNPVKIEVKENPKTRLGAELKYYWAPDKESAPVASEYETIEGSAIKGAKATVYMDGFSVSYIDSNGVSHDISEDIENVSLHKDDGYQSVSYRVISTLIEDGELFISRSSERTFSFETTAPVVKRATQDVEGVTKYGVKLSRPEVFTKGAYIFYTIDGPEPSVVWKQDNEGNWVPDEDNCVGTYYPTSNLDEFLEVGKGHVLKVGAFKYGYKPSIQEFGDNTVLPEALAVQLLELNPTGIGRLVANSNKISKTDKENLGIESISPRTKDHEEDPTIYDVEQTKKIYLTNRAGKDDKYYMVGYTTGKVPQIDEQGNELDIHGNIWTSASGIEKMMVDGITDIAIVDVKNEEAKVVIDDPHLFKWTADYFVFGMDEDTFKTAMTDTENGAGFSEEQYEGIKESARIVFSDSKFYSRANKIEVELNEDDEAEAGEGNYVKKVYYGTVLSRKGSLGTNYMKSTFYYTTPPVVEGGVNQVYKTINHSSFTPTISMPFDLKYKYETYRDPVDDFIPDDHVKFESIGTSVKGISKEQTILFHKDHFTTRHFDAVFSFHRPNVCDDIIENYDIVYDITVESVKMNELTDIEEMIPITRKYVDPRKSKDIHESYYGDSTHDADNRYEFRVNDVHPLGSIHPKITINSVTYIPNGVNDGYATLAANYPTEEMLEELRANDLYSVEKEAPNTPEAASLEGASVTLLWNYNDPEDGTEPTFDWVIVDHNDLRNGATVIDKEVTMEAPFLYHLESIMGTDKNTYKSHKYLIPHNANTCQHGVEGEDPFYGIVLGSYPASYIKNNSGIDPEIVVPTIYITPMYVFKREPQPFVEIEGNGLENYIISESEDAPQSAPQKVITKNELPADLQNIILLRGSNTAIINADSGIFTNVEQMKVDVETVMQVGNDLVLPEGARLFTTGGLEIEPRGLEADVYIVVLRSGKAIKVNVR